MISQVPCPLTNALCDDEAVYLPRIHRRAAVAYRAQGGVNSRLAELLESLGIETLPLSLGGNDPLNSFRDAMMKCDFLISGIGGNFNGGTHTDPDPNAVFQAGMSTSIAKPTILLINSKDVAAPVGTQSSDLLVDCAVHGGMHAERFVTELVSKVSIAHLTLLKRFFAQNSQAFSRLANPSNHVLHDFEFLLRVAWAVDNLPGDVVCISSALERFMDDSTLENLSRHIAERIVDAQVKNGGNFSNSSKQDWDDYVSGLKGSKSEDVLEILLRNEGNVSNLTKPDWDDYISGLKDSKSEDVLEILQGRRTSFRHCVKRYQWTDYFSKEYLGSYLPTEAFSYFGYKLKQEETLALLENMRRALASPNYHVFGVTHRLKRHSGELLKGDRYYLKTLRGADYRRVGEFTWDASSEDIRARTQAFIEPHLTITSKRGIRLLLRKAKEQIISKQP